MAKKKQTRTRSQRPETIEQTLVVIKPDGVQRGLMGEIIQRFEKAGLKIIGMRMRWVDETQAKKHYTEDIAKRKSNPIFISAITKPSKNGSTDNDVRAETMNMTGAR